VLAYAGAALPLMLSSRVRQVARAVDHCPGRASRVVRTLCRQHRAGRRGADHHAVAALVAAGTHSKRLVNWSDRGEKNCGGEDSHGSDRRAALGYRDSWPRGAAQGETRSPRCAAPSSATGSSRCRPPRSNGSSAHRKYGDEGDKLIFRSSAGRARGQREADLALRYDLTVPLAGWWPPMATGCRCVQALRLGPVWRADGRGAGGSRVSTVHLDTWAPPPGGDAETLLAINDGSRAGHRGLPHRDHSRQALHGLLDATGCPKQLGGRVLISLDSWTSWPRTRLPPSWWIAA